MRLGRYAALAAIALVLCVAMAGCGVGGNQKKLLSYFPSEEGFEWEYTGTDDYVQTMGIDSIYKASSGEVTYSISGETVAVTIDDNEPEIEEPAMRRKTLQMEYEFSKDSVIERIVDADDLPHKFSQLEVLRAPIKKGRTWSFQAPDWTDLKAEIVETGKDADKADYVRVKYESEVDGGSYVETRLFKKGLGLVEFTALGPDGAEFVYSLIGN